jgi:hypothetical protein
VAQRPQRGLQARRPPLRPLGTVAARRGCGARRNEKRSGVVGAGSAVEEPPAAEPEKAAPRGEDGGGGHGVDCGGFSFASWV